MFVIKRFHCILKILITGLCTVYSIALVAVPPTAVDFEGQVLGSKLIHVIGAS